MPTAPVPLAQVRVGLRESVVGSGRCAGKDRSGARSSGVVQNGGWLIGQRVGRLGFWGRGEVGVLWGRGKRGDKSGNSGSITGVGEFQLSHILTVAGYYQLLPFFFSNLVFLVGVQRHFAGVLT